MKIIVLLFVSIDFFACAFAPVKPTPCEEVDFYGTSKWKLTADSLNLDLDGDFIGNFSGRISITDSGKVVDGQMSGIFRAPLGDNSFTRTGSMILHGMLIETTGAHNIVFYVISGTDGFRDVTGYIEFDWQENDELIYYGGTFCFEQSQDRQR